MATTPKYKVGFRLYAEVELTEQELIDLCKGDSSYVSSLVQSNQVELGGGDSYLPGEWLSENPDIPDDVKARVLTACGQVNFDDVTIDIW
jgi:hypothetical protein